MSPAGPRALRIVLVGTGEIAAELAACALAQGHRIAGAVDIDPAKLGRDAGVVLGGEPLGVTVVPDVERARDDADVAIVATSSSLDAAAPQLSACARLGLDVVSTCEELVHPWRTHRAVADRLDVEARAHGVTIVGAGINPGFAMDTLALVATAPCSIVRAVRARRVLDASTRRPSFQAKVGVGLTEAEFWARAERGAFGHAGLTESAWMVADHLGLAADRAERELEPVPGDDGGVRGTQQTTSLYAGDEEVVRLEMVMAAGVDEPADTIELDADPPLRLTVAGGIPGDAGTAGVVVNVARQLSGAPAGLLSLADLPLVHARASAGVTHADVPAGRA